jgi:hypothetical protein
VLKELTSGAKQYILFIDDIHTMTGPNAQQGGGVMDASIMLKPLLSRCGPGGPQGLWSLGQPPVCCWTRPAGRLLPPPCRWPRRLAVHQPAFCPR